MDSHGAYSTDFLSTSEWQCKLQANILSKKFHYECRHSSRHKRSPENISDRDKPRPIFHKDLIGEIICAIRKESEKCSTKCYLSERRMSCESRQNNEEKYATDVYHVEEKRWRKSDLSRREMTEILRVPFWSKERDPESIYCEEEDDRAHEDKKYFEHTERWRNKSVVVYFVLCILY